MVPRSLGIAAALLLFATSAPVAHADLWSPYRLADLNAQQFNQRVISDGAGAAIIAWRDTRNGVAEIFVQHILSSGSVDPAFVLLE